MPHILRSNLITIEEAEKLIKMCVYAGSVLLITDLWYYRYWDYMNLSVSLLDPVIYTMEYLVVHSPFLFTVSKWIRVSSF